MSLKQSPMVVKYTNMFIFKPRIEVYFQKKVSLEYLFNNLPQNLNFLVYFIQIFRNFAYNGSKFIVLSTSFFLCPILALTESRLIERDLTVTSNHLTGHTIYFYEKKFHILCHCYLKHRWLRIYYMITNIVMIYVKFI